MWRKIEKLLIEQEKYLNLIFDSYKGQCLANTKENYQYLMKSHRLEFENYLNDLKKKHKNNYENLKNSLKKSYQKAFNLAQIKLQSKLLQKNKKSVPKLSIEHDDTHKNVTISFLKQKTEKFEMFYQNDQKLTFCKNKIKSVLNNYSKLVISMENLNSNKNYILDKEKMFEKYLSFPTTIQLKQLIYNEELPEIAVLI